MKQRLKNVRNALLQIQDDFHISKKYSEIFVVFSGTQMERPLPLKNWLVMYPKREFEAFKGAKSMIMKVAAEFGLQPEEPKE
jgi:hypothetical protein